MTTIPSSYLVKDRLYTFVDYHAEFLRLGEIGFFNCFERNRGIYMALCHSALRRPDIPPAVQAHALFLGTVGNRAYVSCSIVLGGGRHATILLSSDMLILWMEEREHMENVVRGEVMRSLSHLATGATAAR